MAFKIVQADANLCIELTSHSGCFVPESAGKNFHRRQSSSNNFESIIQISRRCFCEQLYQRPRVRFQHSTISPLLIHLKLISSRRHNAITLNEMETYPMTAERERAKIENMAIKSSTSRQSHLHNIKSIITLETLRSRSFRLLGFFLFSEN